MAYNETPVPNTHWYTSIEQTTRFARILVESGVLLSADDVVDYFEEPWKRTREYQIWDDAGRPRPPSPDDLAEARMSGTGPRASELERKYSHDRQQWNAFVGMVEAYEDGRTPLAGLPTQDTNGRTTL
jgi:hypothetical protein